MPDQPDHEEALAKSNEGQDWLLELVSKFAHSGVSQSVTLFVGGAVISGEIISGQDYFEEMAKIAESANFHGPDGSEKILSEMSQGYRKFKKFYDKPDDAGDDWTTPTDYYIHLKGARVFTSNGTIPGRGDFLWRGRISCVDAWSIGGMTP